MLNGGENIAGNPQLEGSFRGTVGTFQISLSVLLQDEPWREGTTCLVLLLARVLGNPCPGQTEVVGHPVKSSGPVEHFPLSKVRVSTVRVPRTPRACADCSQTKPRAASAPGRAGQVERSKRALSGQAVSALQAIHVAPGHRKGGKAVGFHCKDGFCISFCSL